MENSSVSDDYKILLKQIGANIAKARLAKGVSQRELGKSANKSPSMIAKVEKFAPQDISLRNIYEVTRLIPVSLGEIILEAEKDLELHQAPRTPQTADQRLTMLLQRVAVLPQHEQQWMADMIEGLLARTSSPSRLTDITDNRPEAVAGYPS